MKEYQLPEAVQHEFSDLRLRVKEAVQNGRGITTKDIETILRIGQHRGITITQGIHDHNGNEVTIEALQQGEYRIYEDRSVTQRDPHDINDADPDEDRASDELVIK